MFKQFFLSLCLFFLIIQIHAQTRDDGSYSLNENWKFILNDNTAYQKTDFNDQTWQTINLPDDWAFRKGYAEDNAQQAKGGYAVGGIGWYRNAFMLAKAQCEQKKLYIHFDGVYMNSEVWLNGHYLGKRPYGYISFEYDITPYVIAGTNQVSVRVDNEKAKSARWYHGCGIYGNVTIIERNLIHFAQNSIYVRTSKVNLKQAEVAVDWQTNASVDQAKSLAVDCELRTSDGELAAYVFNKPTVLGKEKLKLELQNPHLWDIKDPYLYTLKMTLRDHKKVVDVQTIRMGVRSIAWDTKTGFWLNGRNLKIWGVCEHLEGGPVGAAWTRNLLKWKIAQLKAMGCNAIRTSHNPQVPMFYDLCDEMGMLVFDEAFDGWRQKADEDYGKQAFDEWWERDLRSFIRRDRNHPSIFLWSVGNETYGDIAPRLVQTCHEEDSTRLVTTSWSNNEDMDVFGGNGATENKGFIENFKALDKPFLGTEYPHNGWCRGLYHTLTYYRNGFPNWHDDPFETPNLTDKEIFQYACASRVNGNYKKYQLRSSYDNIVVRQNVRQMLALMRDNAWFSGAFRWTGFDYYGECGPGSWPVRGGQSGVLDFAGLRKDAFYLYQSEWTTDPMVHILPHWTHPMMKLGTKIPVMVYTTGDEVELFLNGQSLGKKVKGTAWQEMAPTWMVPYKTGKLLAIAYKKGLELAREEVCTASEPTQLKIKVEDSFLTGEKSDLHVITIAEQDKQGTMYPYGENRVHYFLDGKAEVFSAENGCYYDDETNYHATSRTCFFGLQRIFVRKKDPKAAVTLYAGAILGDKQLQLSNKISIDVKAMKLHGVALPADCQIYYTTDGSKPTISSKVYMNSFPVTLGTTVRALVCKDSKELFSMQEKFAKEEGLYWGEPLVVEQTNTSLQTEAMKLINCEVKKDVDRAFIEATYIRPNKRKASCSFYKENDGKSYKTTLTVAYRYLAMKPFSLKLYNNGKLVSTKKMDPENERKVNRWWQLSMDLPLASGANQLKLEIESEKEVGFNWVIIN